MRKIFLFATLAASLQAAAVSPYINKVWDYCPAPGQFVNEIPEWEEDMSREAVIAAADEALNGASVNKPRPGMISLGAFGGYVVFGFDHPVVNVDGENDFVVYGNAFNGLDSSTSISSEPGIVMVSADTNGNGLPDDEWFELRGSEYANAARGVTVTYYRPDPDRAPGADPDPEVRDIIDRTYIRFTTTDAAHAEGYIMRNSYHLQSYWPEWNNGETLTFTGTLLPDNGRLEDGIYAWRPFEWGYADNKANADKPAFDIADAVDSDGNSVSLDKIDFVKVYTGVCMNSGALGESSTEITGAEDLHPDAQGALGTIEGTDGGVVMHLQGNSLNINVAVNAPLRIFAIDGTEAMSRCLTPGENVIGLEGLSNGIYIAVIGTASLKISL